MRCTGCGYCCRSGPCLAALIRYGFIRAWGLFRENGGCPALWHDGARYWCGLYDLRLKLKRLGLVGRGDDCVMR